MKFRKVPSHPHGNATTNFELKTSDHTGNPYLVLGAMIAAGLDGIEKGLLPGQPIQMDPALLGSEDRLKRGITQLPDNLNATIDELEKDEVIGKAMGPELLRSYLAVKRYESEYFKGMSLEDEVRILYDKY